MTTKTTNQPEYRFNDAQHLHELLVDGVWKPLTGTSSVLSVLNKPGLTYWASGLSVKEFGCPDPKVLTRIKNKKATDAEIADLAACASAKRDEILEMSLNEYMRLLDKAYRAHATTLKETAEEGTDLHAVLSSFVRTRMGLGPMGLKPEPSILQKIIPFVFWTDANVDQFLWSESHCYSKTHWIGGISDCGFIDKQGRMGILDFKSSKEAYLSQFWQCAAYDLQIMENGGFDAEGNKTFCEEGMKKPFDYYCVLPFGMAEPKVQINEDTEGCKENFLHALALYKACPKD